MIARRIMLPLRRLAEDRTGATIIEFAVVLPTFLLLLFGIFDIGMSIYTQAVFQGALQDAARDAGLESGKAQQNAIDQYVKGQVSAVVPNAEYTIKRSNYQTFSDVGRPEEFVDANGNDSYDSNECFIDENSNSSWDADVGKSGLGGANDVVFYEMTVSYDRIFPLWRLINGDQRTTIYASTSMRNQPFGTQASRAKTTICPEPL